MCRNGGGISVSSAFGSYAVVMHGVSAISDSLRQELSGSGIAVSVICPALTATDLLRDRADASATARPIPRDAPVTRTTLPAKCTLMTIPFLVYIQHLRTSPPEADPVPV